MTDLVYTMNSNTFGYYTSFYKDCFYLEMKQQRSRLYVMYLSDYHYNSDMEPQLEIWLCTKYSGNKFLCSTYQNDNFKNTIYALYNSICEYSKHPKIEEEYKNIIDSYMNDEECEDTNDLIESDDLPFY